MFHYDYLLTVYTQEYINFLWTEHVQKGSWSD